jgi:RNAse (barnase) inhibitor barstar
MNTETDIQVWQRHLVGVQNPLVHLVPSIQLNVPILETATKELAFDLFVIDGRRVESASALMDAFAEAMDFPTYFRRNWDSLLDLTRDLSWKSAKGYVLLFSCADHLLHIGEDIFSSLILVLEATVRNWRDERGEYAERTEPIPFHIILSGSDELTQALVRESREPLCIHEPDLSIHIVRTPGGIGEAETFRDAQKLLRSGADLELILLFFRDRGYGQLDSTYALAALLDETIPQAKTLVEQSQTWRSQLREDDLRRREQARRALRDLGFS